MMKVISTLLIILSTSSLLSAQSLKPVNDGSEIQFTIKNFGLNVTGHFSGLTGTIQFDPSNLSTSSFNVSVDATTVNTGVDMRDNHLKKEEYFNTAKYPAINFTSTHITGDANGYTVSGRLTIKGTTKEISFPFTAVRQGDGFIFSGNFSINRKDFDLGGGSAVMGNNVDVSLKVFAK
ncbi:MAG TPA: YceI family protein [Parafilimonas sp.]|nr:YceI family protein [Parafilimonas sp.]